MRSTRVLLNIVYILITAIFVVLLVTYREEVTSTIHSTINEVLKEKVIIPSERYNTRSFTFETVRTTEDFEPNNLDELKNIYYTVLNNGWTNFTFYCPSDYKTCVDDTLKLANKSDYLEIINYYVSPYNNYSLYNTKVSTTGEVNLSVDKVYEDSEIEYLKKYVDEVLRILNINPDETPTKEDLKKIHDYLISKISYDEDYKESDINSNSNNAYGAVTTHKAICSGYTDIYALFLDRLNVKNIKLPSENHIWNYVYFKNKWYHIDLTWDDDEVNKNNTSNFFMIDTKKLFELDKEKHNFNKEFFIETKE